MTSAVATCDSHCIAPPSLGRRKLLLVHTDTEGVSNSSLTLHMQSARPLVAPASTAPVTAFQHTKKLKFEASTARIPLGRDPSEGVQAVCNGKEHPFAATKGERARTSTEYEVLGTVGST